MSNPSSEPGPSPPWSETCPHCGAKVQAIARRCVACGGDIETGDPMPDLPTESSCIFGEIAGGAGCMLGLILFLALVALALAIAFFVTCATMI